MNTSTKSSSEIIHDLTLILLENERDSLTTENIVPKYLDLFKNIETSYNKSNGTKLQKIKTTDKSKFGIY